VKPRYAIYFVPRADSAVYRFGAAALGYDCYTASDIDFPDPLPIPQPAWSELTSEPRRYGFHATLKAPFFLADDIGEAALVAGFDAVCRTTALPVVFAPAVTVVEGFVAIVPAAPEPAIDRLAAACVTAFDRFRAPLSAHERARRMSTRLSPRQADQLDRWGYPYVFEDFRLHLTLTGRLATERQDAVLRYLREHFAALHASVVRIDRLTLLRQERPDARFVVIRQAGIGAESAYPGL